MMHDEENGQLSGGFDWMSNSQGKVWLIKSFQGTELLIACFNGYHVHQLDRHHVYALMGKAVTVHFDAIIQLFNLLSHFIWWSKVMDAPSNGSRRMNLLLLLYVKKFNSCKKAAFWKSDVTANLRKVERLWLCPQQWPEPHNVPCFFTRLDNVTSFDLGGVELQSFMNSSPVCIASACCIESLASALHCCILLGFRVQSISTKAPFCFLKRAETSGLKSELLFFSWTNTVKKYQWTSCQVIHFICISHPSNNRY